MQNRGPEQLLCAQGSHHNAPQGLREGTEVTLAEHNSGLWPLPQSSSPVRQLWPSKGPTAWGAQTGSGRHSPPRTQEASLSWPEDALGTGGLAPLQAHSVSSVYSRRWLASVAELTELRV